MARVTLEGVTRTFGSFRAVDDVSLQIQEGEFVTLLGPSGCGKTTTLRLIAGFLGVNAGRVLIGDQDVTHVPPRRRSIGMVFQDYALFPHMTVAENIAFGPQQRKVPKAEISTTVARMLDLVQLTDTEDRYPSQLSGGQQQRIAFARALAYSPRVLLMDEPLGALDLKLRQTMQIELRRLQQELNITTVFVTHDQEEAMNLSDRIAVMNRGHIEQIGAPETLYSFPRTSFVADFIGRINFLDGVVVSRDENDCVVELGQGQRIMVPAAQDVTEGTAVRTAVRPEKLTLQGEPPAAGWNRLRGVIDHRRFLGNTVHYLLRLPDGARLLVENKPGDDAFRQGEAAWVAWRMDDGLAFPGKSWDSSRAPIPDP